MVHDFDYGPSAYSMPFGFPDNELIQDGARGGCVKEPGAYEQPDEVEAISLTNIDRAKVVHALIEGAAEYLVMQAARDDRQPPENIQVPKVTAIRRHLTALRGELRDQAVPDAEWAEVLLDDHPMEKTPPLPGFKPLAGVISAETIRELDAEYVAGFTVHRLQELINERDEQAERKAVAGNIAGKSTVAASIEATNGRAAESGDALLPDNPENEFYFRLRAGQLYVGDMPFMHWYGLLHGKAVDFIQELRQGGTTDLPDVHKMKREKVDQLTTYIDYLAEPRNADLPPVIVRTRTGLPEMSSDDSDIDVESINEVFHGLGYPADQNFVYDALYPALVRAPHVKGVGPLRNRDQAPDPEMPEEQRLRLERWLRYGSAITSSPNAQVGGETDGATDSPYSDTVALERFAPDDDQNQPDEAYAAPETIALGYDDFDEGGTKQLALRPSDRTRARIGELNRAMYMSEGPLPWSIAGAKRWGHFLLLVAQSISGN